MKETFGIIDLDRRWKEIPRDLSDVYQSINILRYYLPTISGFYISAHTLFRTG